MEWNNNDSLKPNRSSPENNPHLILHRVRDTPSKIPTHCNSNRLMLSYVSLSDTFPHHPLNTSSDSPTVWSRIWSSLSIRTSSGFACKGFGDDEIKPEYSGLGEPNI